MWPFRRRPQTADPVAAPEGWRDVAPIERTLPAIQATVATSEFARALASWQRPVSMVGPLEHAVNERAPSGLVSGLVRPAVQRSASTRSQEPITFEPARPSIWTSPASSALPDDPTPAPLQRLPSELSEAPAMPEEPRELPAAPEPFEELHDESLQGADEEPEELLPEDEPQPISRKLGLGTPIGHVHVQRKVVTPQPNSSPAPVSEARPIGFGPPLDRDMTRPAARPPRPDTAAASMPPDATQPAVQRVETSAPITGADPLVPSTGDLAYSQRGDYEPRELEVERSTPGAGTPEPDLTATAADASANPGAPSVPTISARPLNVSVQRATQPPTDIDTPPGESTLVARVPIGGSEPGLSPASASPSPNEPGPAWAVPTGGQGSTGAGDAEAEVTETLPTIGAIALQSRFAPSSSAPPTDNPATAFQPEVRRESVATPRAAGRERTFAPSSLGTGPAPRALALQRVAMGASPAGHSRVREGYGRRDEAGPQAPGFIGGTTAPFAVVPPMNRETPPSMTEWTIDGGFTSAESGFTASTAIAVQRKAASAFDSGESLQPPPETTTVQRAPDAASAPVAEVAQTPPTQAPASAMTGKAPATPAELDDLARRLYSRICDRLRAELRLDRERSGSLMNRR